MESPLQKMMNRQVVVKTGEVVYRGRLVEITEDAVCLMARTGWRQIAMERIVSIAPLLEPDAAVNNDEDDAVSSENFRNNLNFED